MSINNKNLIIINQVRKNNLITDLLEKEGYTPSFSHRDKHLYLCPLPGHTETKPSFVLYDKPDSYQNYFCFGCKKSGDIVSLYALLKGMSWSKALEALGGKVDVSGEQELSFLVNSIKKEYKEGNEEIKDILDDISLELGTLGLVYLEQVDYDTEELKFLDKIYKKIDSLISAENVSELISVYNFMVGENEYHISPFKIRQQQWEKRKYR